MKGESTIKNICLASHAGAGKTFISEAFLYLNGLVDRLGRVDEGNTVSDYDADEIKRRNSINLSILPINLEEFKLNLIDLPGFDDFIGDIKAGLHISDGAVVVVSGTSGVEVGTEKVWGYAQENNLPLIFLINKMEREGANFFKNFEELRATFGTSVIPLVGAIGEGVTFKGIYDFLVEESFGIPKGKEETTLEITDLQKKEFQIMRELLVEKLVELDDDLLNKYLEGQDIETFELIKALEVGIKERRIFPVLACSAANLAGLRRTLHYLKAFPDAHHKVMMATNTRTGEKVQVNTDVNKPFSAFVFKTVADPYVGQLNYLKVQTGKLTPDSVVVNVNKNKEEKISQLYRLRGKNQSVVEEVFAGDIVIVTKLQDTHTNDTLSDKNNSLLYDSVKYPSPMAILAVKPLSKGDEDKLGGALQKMLLSDPTLSVEREITTNQVLIKGMGEVHLEAMIDRLQSKFGAKVLLEEPKIPYKETASAKVESEYKHKKQSGGRGQFGHVFLRIQPLPRGDGFIFDEEIFGGSVPKQYVPSVEKGVRESLHEGVLAGFPIVDIKVTLFDGSYHEVDSSDISFKIAGQMALKKGMLQAKPQILEPMVKLFVVVPETFMGDVISDLNTRRARILGIGEERNLRKIESLVPLAEILRYGASLRSITQGRGSFSYDFFRYEEVPAHIQEKIIAETKASKEEEA
ncbi:MAG: Elongation factor G [candidate division WS2 bacterium]|nr:Elongation factor G [Candidatus Lithacetigena glycinireducens]